MAKKKLHEITEISPESAAKIEEAKKAGVQLVAHDPNRVQAFLHGHITLGELEGISKESQYQMAKIGYDYLREGKLDQAQKVFEGLRALDPFDAYFLTVLGAIAQEKGDAEQADKLYSRALEINPFSVMALANRGEIRLSQGRVDEAIADLAKALSEDPEGKEPASRRARVLVAMMRDQLEASKADPTKAAREARKALEGSNQTNEKMLKPSGTVTPPPAATTGSAKLKAPLPEKAKPPVVKPPPAKTAQKKPAAATSKPAAKPAAKADPKKPTKR